MATNHPDRPKRYETLEQWFKSMNQLMQEKPVKGLLESIDDFFRHPFPHSSLNLRVHETVKEYVVTAELPGVKREEISIDIINNSLTILVNKTQMTSEINEIAKTEKHMASSRQSSRTIPFAHPINEKRAQASYRDGLLEIRIAKKQGKKLDILIEE
ncbi:Hsp20/alpha crystallin family protein [Mesobacillus jeotgali]|uniref:Hsp20/alpha crystallin family protein n=1 Tax=Mesobacillus jeotgali TaxID=129985 RepID=UPI0009A7D75C|nr:Hsp20/alpha crystallin family protein [Mesobacillus jeotgali]